MKKRKNVGATKDVIHDAPLYRSSAEADSIARKRAQLVYFNVVCEQDEKIYRLLAEDIFELYKRTGPGVYLIINSLEEAVALHTYNKRLSAAQKTVLGYLISALDKWYQLPFIRSVDPENRWIVALAMSILRDLSNSATLGNSWLVFNYVNGWKEPKPELEISFNLASSEEAKEAGKAATQRLLAGQPAHTDESKQVIERRKYNPSFETRENARLRIMKLCEQSVDRYLDSVEEKIRKDDYKLVKQTRARSGTKNEHFRWLFLYQVLGMSVKEITDSLALDGTDVSEAVVSKAIREKAELVGTPST